MREALQRAAGPATALWLSALVAVGPASAQNYVEVFFGSFSGPGEQGFEAEVFVQLEGATTVELTTPGLPGFVPLTQEGDGEFVIETDEGASFSEIVGLLDGQVQLRIDAGLPTESIYAFTTSIGTLSLGDLPAAATIVSPTLFETGVDPEPTIQWVPGGGQERVVALEPPFGLGLEEFDVGTPFGTLTLDQTQWTPPPLESATEYELVVIEADRRQDLVTGLTRLSGDTIDWSVSPVALPGTPDGTPLGVILSESFIFFTTTGAEPLAGDLNGDGFVGAGDLDILLGVWNLAADPGEPADLNGDGFVGAGDLDILLGNWNAGTPGGGAAALPGPGTGLLALAGALALARRRRRAG